MSLSPEQEAATEFAQNLVRAGSVSFLADDVQLKRKVALLKILPNRIAANQDRLRRFNQEAMAHPRHHLLFQTT